MPRSSHRLGHRSRFVHFTELLKLKQNQSACSIIDDSLVQEHLDLGRDEQRLLCRYLKLESEDILILMAGNGNEDLEVIGYCIKNSLSNISIGVVPIFLAATELLA